MHVDNRLVTGQILIHDNTKNKILILDNNPTENSRPDHRVSVWVVWNISRQELENITLVDLYKYRTYIKNEKGEKNGARK